VRFNVSPETAHSTGMTKPTAFDGMFPEWISTNASSPFGVTGGGKREGVASRIPIDKVQGVDVFAGVPEQLGKDAKLPNAPRSESEEAVLRQDNDFSSAEVTKNGRTGRKSHLDENGNLTPANPDGEITPLQHIIGGIDEKNDSPFTSFMTVEDGVEKSYGSQEIQVDLERLIEDVAEDKVTGVEVMRPKHIQQQIVGELHMLGLDEHAIHEAIEQALANGDVSGAIEMVQRSSLSNKKKDKAERRIVALYNTSRDQEVLIKGVIPSEYLNRNR
jgi:hypothetical protein